MLDFIVIKNLAYTKVFLRLIMEMIRTSMLSEKQMMKMLKLVSRLYLVSPLEIRVRLTIQTK